jgi:hypothetical protein
VRCHQSDCEGGIFSRTSMHCLAVCVKCKYTHTQRGSTASWPLLSTPPLGWFRSFSLVLFAVEKIKGDGGGGKRGSSPYSLMELSVRSPGFLSIFPLSRHLTERTVCTRSDAPPFQAFYVIRRDCCNVCVCVHSHILYRYILDVFFV